MRKNNILEGIYSEVAKEFDIPVEVVATVYRSIFYTMREEFKVIPMDDISSEEELDKYNRAFNLPRLGKFFINYRRIETIRKIIKDNEARKINNQKDTAVIHEDIDDC